MPCNDELDKLSKSEYDHLRVNLFDLFEKYGFCGTGWGGRKLIAGMSETDVERITHFDGSDLKNCSAICRMKPNDYIWVNVAPKRSYYLFKVSENLTGDNSFLKEIESKEELDDGFFLKNDIGNCFKGEWRRIQKAIVPEEICKFMRGRGMTFMVIRDALEITEKLWNSNQGVI